MYTWMHVLEMRRNFVEDPRVSFEKQEQNQEWWKTEDASPIRENAEAWKVIENIKVNENQPGGGMLHVYGQKKKRPITMWTRPGIIWKQTCTLN